MSSVDVQRMPSTPLAPRDLKDDSLIANKLSSDLDKKFVSSSKQVLLQRIEFKAATKPDEQYEKLKKKYPPLNATNGLNMQHYRNGSLSTSEVGADEDIPAAKVVLHSPENLQLEWKSVRRIGPGLSNMGNTCFLNSVLQVLTYTAPLVNYLYTGPGHCKECRVVGFCMMCELQRHIGRTLNHNQNQTIKPMAIINKLKLIAKHFKYGHQEDAHEFLRYVIEGMQKSCLPSDMEKKLDRYSKETSVVHAIFGGYYRSQVRCLKCHNTSNTFDPLMEIMLDIKHAPSVTRALQRSVKIELLDGENLYQCPRCKKKVPAHKQVLIHRTPNVLTVHLKRFDYNQMFGGKISREVEYSEQLDLRPFMTTKGPPVLYRLYAVLVHSGYSCNSGHYYCYVRASNGTWYNMNDSVVRQAGLKAVLSQQAYLLFYMKIHKEEPKALTKGILRQTSLNIPTTPTSASSPNAPRLIRDNDLGTPVSKAKYSAFAKTTPTSTSTITKSTASPTSASGGLTPSSERPRLSFSIPAKSKIQQGNAGPSNSSLNKAESSKMDTTVSAASTDLSPKKLPVSDSSKDRSSDASSGQASVVTPTKESTSCFQAESFPLRKGDTGRSPSPKKPRPPPLFIPRAVGQATKRNSREGSDHGKEEAKSTTPKATTPWKVTPKQGSELLFGPMSPPPSGAVLPQQSPSSVRSDMSSSTSSIMGKSGEWTVSSKFEGTPGPRLPERQHAGWQVREKKDQDVDLKKEEANGQDEEEEKRKKKKKHKKEKRKKKEKAKGKYQNLDDSESEVDDEKKTTDTEKTKKNKKRKKKRKSKKQTGSDSSSDLDKDTERKSLLSEESRATKNRKRKGDRDNDDNDKAKKHRLVDYSDESSSEGDAGPAGSGDNSAGGKSRLLNGGTNAKVDKRVPVIHDGETPKAPRKVLWDGSRDSSVVKELLQSGGGLKGYGSSVTSWEGGQSVVDSHGKEDAGSEQNRRDSDDEWNESIDRGKVKKVKKEKSSEEKSSRYGCNPFQRAHDRRSGKEKNSDRPRHNRHRHKSNKGYRKF